jgi:hypothetical protein
MVGPLSRDGAVKTEDHRQALEGNIVHEVIVGPLEERNRSRTGRSFGCQTPAT